MRSKVGSTGRRGRRKVQLNSTSDSGRIHLLEVIGDLGNAEEATQQALRLAEDLKRERPVIAVKPRNIREQ